MSSDVVLSNLCPIGTPESESSSSTSTTASDTGSALDIGSIRLPASISSDSDSVSDVSSNKLPSNPMTSPNETCCPSESPTNDRASTGPTSSSATARGMSHPLRRLGRFINSYLASDLLTGVLALFSFLGTLLVGLWGVVLTRKQLDLGEWTFCKSYPNDTQVLSSTTCQRYAGKQSLDYLTKRKNEAALSTYDSLDLNLSFLYISERIPDWIYTPPAADRSSCSIMCHPRTAHGLFWDGPQYSSQDACAELNRILLIHISIQATIHLIIYCYHGLGQLWTGINLKKVPMDSGRTIVADLYLYDSNMPFNLRWYVFNFVLTVLVVLLGKHSFDGPADYLTFIELLVFQVLTALTSILLINVLFRHFQLHPMSKILRGRIPWGTQDLRCIVSFLPQHRFVQGFVLFAVSMLWRNITATTYCAFILDLGSRYNGSPSQIKHQEARTQYPDNSETSTVFNEAGTQEQGQYISTRATDTTNQPPQEDGESQVAAYVPNPGPTPLGQIRATTRRNWNRASTTMLEIWESVEHPGLSNRVRNIVNQGLGEEVTLDPRFKIHSSEDFKPGQVFKTMWSEPVDNFGYDTGEAKWSRDLGHPYLRRFVIKNNDKGHSECLPVVNYNPAGSRKASLGVELLEQDYYAVIYAGQTPPELSKPELALRRSPIRILPNTPEDKLPLGSWINYAKKYTIGHNVKVVFIGSIAPDSQLIFNKDFDLIWSKKSS